MMTADGMMGCGLDVENNKAPRLRGFGGGNTRDRTADPLLVRQML